MKVCIAEKPSVAREIAEVLGATKKMNGYIEGNGYQVTWTFGHLCTLKEPNDYSENWKRWSLASLPMIPPRFGIKLISNPTYEQQFKTIEELMQNAEMVINCGAINMIKGCIRFIRIHAFMGFIDNQNIPMNSFFCTNFSQFIILSTKIN